MRRSGFLLVSVMIACSVASARNDWTGYWGLANNRDLAGTGLKPIARGGELDKHLKQ